jgi:hypothetical protein
MGQLRVTAKMRELTTDSDRGAADKCTSENGAVGGGVRVRGEEFISGNWKPAVWRHTYRSHSSSSIIIDRSPSFGGHLSRTVTDCHDAHALSGE